MPEQHHTDPESQRHRARPLVRKLIERNTALLRTALDQCQERLEQPPKSKLDHQIYRNVLARHAAITTLLDLGSIPDLESVRRNLPTDAAEISDDVLETAVSSASRVNTTGTGEGMPTMAMYLDLSDEDQGLTEK